MSGDVAVLVLAAGLGRRFGAAPKLLAPLRGKPLLRHAVDVALAAGVGPVSVVLGHRADVVETALEGLVVETVLNPAHAHGLSTSLRAGFAALPPTIRAVVVMLGDMPDVPPAVVQGLVARWRLSGAPAVVPVAGGRRANPVLIDRRLAPAIAALAGDAGAGALLRSLAGVEEWVLDEPGLLADVDTPAGLAGTDRQRLEC